MHLLPGYGAARIACIFSQGAGPLVLGGEKGRTSSTTVGCCRCTHTWLRRGMPYMVIGQGGTQFCEEIRRSSVQSFLCDFMSSFRALDASSRGLRAEVGNQRIWSKVTADVLWYAYGERWVVVYYQRIIWMKRGTPLANTQQHHRTYTSHVAWARAPKQLR